MKILKYLLFLLLIFIIAGSIYVATKETEYKITVSRRINAPASLLFQEIADLTNWKTWDGWAKAEGIQIQVSEKSKGEGASFRWEADNFRDGIITTTALITNRELEQALKLNTSTGTAEGNITWTITGEAARNEVTWTLTGSHTFKDKLAFILQDRSLEEIFLPIFKKNLEDLEEDVIKKMEAYSINVDGITEHGGGYYMYTSTASKIGAVNPRARKMIDQISVYMEKNNISISGKSFVVYHQRDERNGTTIFSAAVPTPSQVITPRESTVLNGYLEPQKVLKTTLKGHRKNMPEAWERAFEYMKSEELEQDSQGQAFAIYLTGPDTVDNPALWVTELYIPVK